LDGFVGIFRWVGRVYFYFSFAQGFIGIFRWVGRVYFYLSFAQGFVVEPALTGAWVYWYFSLGGAGLFLFIVCPGVCCRTRPYWFLVHGVGLFVVYEVWII
jgi:hypothetical protein